MSKYNKSVFSGQMNLRITAKLLKNAPVLKGLESCSQLVPVQSGFQGYLIGGTSFRGKDIEKKNTCLYAMSPKIHIVI